MATGDVGLVLVHGGGTSSACWDVMVPLLTTPAVAVDLPGRGRRPADLSQVTLDDFADAVVEDIDAAGWERVVLVGHSLAGMTLPRVANRIPERLARLVFVSCTVPAHGQDCVDTLDPELRDFARQNIEAHGGIAHAPDTNLSNAMYGNDLSAEQLAWVVERNVDDAGRVLLEPCDLTGVDQVPRTWVRLLQDAVVAPAKQDRYIANIGGADVVDLDAGHMAMVSRPAELAAILDDIATRAGDSSTA